LRPSDGAASAHRFNAEGTLDWEIGPKRGDDVDYGALRVRDGKELTRCAASRNSKGS